MNTKRNFQTRRRPNITPPKVLFEDTHILVISKPAGLLSQGDISGAAHLVDWVRKYLRQDYVGLIHRLDRNTSGIMLVAKKANVARKLTDDLRADKITRKYLGWVVGDLNEKRLWRHYLAKDKGRNEVRVVGETFAGAKEAVLWAEPVEKGNWKETRLTLVRFSLETGRSHQIRVQSAEEGFPLLGDRKYGAPTADFGRPALHSSEISFMHPGSGEILKFQDPLPADMSFRIKK